MQYNSKSYLSVPLTVGLLLACDSPGIIVGDVRLGSSAASMSAKSPQPSAGLPIAEFAADASVAAFPRPDFILGADLSWVQEQEQLGLTFLDHGVQTDILQILKSHGFNFVRLRLFHTPSSACRPALTGSDQTCGYQHDGGELAEPFCDLEHSLRMAKRIKAAGLGLLLNFHFSDTWADPNDQNKPLAWEKLSYPELKSALHGYTFDTLTRFREADARPDIVQLGNGVTAGILFPDGESSDKNWPQLAELLSAAGSGVREVDPSIQIMLHLEKPDSFSTSDWWIKSALEHGVKFDILGQTCFTGSNGQLDSWKSSFSQLSTKYPQLKFLVAEYSEQKRAVNDLMFNLPNSKGLGSFVWEPTRWREMLFDRNDTQLSGNDLLNQYDAMARDYGVASVR